MASIPILPDPYETPPLLDRINVPDLEMASFLHVQTLLQEVGSHMRNFRLAVYLYEYSEHAVWEIEEFATRELSLWTSSGWQFIAARDGAMSIYHFGCAIDGIRQSLSATPTLNAKVDHQALRTARNIFGSLFPGHLALRHVVAHVADFSQTLEKKASHAVKGPFRKGLFMSDDPKGVTWLPGNMNNSTYAVTFNGEAFSYDLNSTSIGKLGSIKDRIYSAFAGSVRNEASAKSPK